MARIRSPNYPSMSLGDAVKKVAQVFEKEQQHPMDREVLMKGLGYAGVNGASLSAISAVQKYGLVDHIGEDYKVSDRALAVLHPHSQDEKASALREAALLPSLFAELHEQFSGSIPSDDNLRSYLIRRGFATGAITGVIGSFRETMQYVKDYANGLPMETPAIGTHSPVQGSKGHMSLPPPRYGAAPTDSESRGQQSVPLKVSFFGDQLEVSATLFDVESVEKLIRVLEANKPLLPAKRGSNNATEQDGSKEGTS